MSQFKMKYVITPSYLTKNSKRRSGNLMSSVGFIVAHDTGNPDSTAKGNVKWYEDSRNEMSASAHIFVDDTSIVECIPLLTGSPEKAWHVLYDKPLDNKLFGDDANDIAGGIEYCYGKGINADEAYKRYVWVIAYAFYKFNISPTKLIGHHVLDPERKTDPKSGLAASGRTYEQLLKDVVKEYEECTKAEEAVILPAGISKERVGTTDIYWIKLEQGTIEKADLIHKKGAKVSEITKESGADFGINFPYFNGTTPLGDTEDDDKVISSAYGKMLKWHEFAFVDGKPVIGQLNKDSKQDFLAQGAPLLIENGKPVYEFYRINQEVQDDIGKSSAQRTFIGIDAKGALIIAVADGRTASSKGLTLKEMADFMLAKGAVWALNGDGGGSSTLATKGGVVVNQNKGSDERATSHAIVFYLKKPQEAKKLTKFKDVPAGAWYESAVKVVSDLGIMGGDTQDNFNPDKPLTRAEMAAIIAKLHSKGMIK